jgi:hypothetical protein
MNKRLIAELAASAWRATGNLLRGGRDQRRAEGTGLHHRGATGMEGSDDLCVVNARDLDRRDAEILVAKLTVGNY